MHLQESPAVHRGAEGSETSHPRATALRVLHPFGCRANVGCPCHDMRPTDWEVCMRSGRSWLGAAGLLWVAAACACGSSGSSSGTGDGGAGGGGNGTCMALPFTCTGGAAYQVCEVGTSTGCSSEYYLVGSQRFPCASCGAGCTSAAEQATVACYGSASGSGSGGGSGGGSGSSSGGTVDAGAVTVVCDMSSNATCTISRVPASEQSTYESVCTSQGGTVGTACPTTGLLGCCTVSGNGSALESCVYGADAGNDSFGCMASGGTWSTTP
jgi:hypothetical protein